MLLNTCTSTVSGPLLRFMVLQFPECDMNVDLGLGRVAPD